jgi:hypothetical protein
MALWQYVTRKKNNNWNKIIYTLLLQQMILGMIQLFT